MVRPFVLGAPPLDTSPLSLRWHKKTLLPAKLPQCLVSQLATSCNTMTTQAQCVQQGQGMHMHTQSHIPLSSQNDGSSRKFMGMQLEGLLYIKRN
jgi:hypothetical protein